MSFQVWFAFMLACWVISLSPGAGAIASMSSGLNYGFKHGYWNAIGLQLALIIQIMIVAAGVGVLFATTPWAFQVVKWFGVTYVQWTAPAQNIDIQTEQKNTPALVLVFKGFIVNMSNPKAIVFLLAVLPQFLDLNQPQWIQYVIMAITMVVIDLMVMAAYTGLASKILRLLRSPRQQKYLNRSFAVMFGCAAALLSAIQQTS